jgi:N-acetylneuraminic acid mutarotase
MDIKYKDYVVEMYVYQINESEFWKCQNVNLKFGPKLFNALVDTGSQISLISGEVYDNLRTVTTLW